MVDIKNRLKEFASNRDWEKFHTPKNLVMAISGEVGELADIFQWKTEEQSSLSNLTNNDYARVKEEMADIFLYLIRLADILNVDLEKEGYNKIELNELKYPIDLSKGNAIKYNRRDE